MNRLQKIAWFILVVWSLLAVLAVLVVLEMFTSGTGARTLLMFWLVLSLAYIGLLTVMLLYRKRNAQKVDFDERDRMITDNAGNAAFFGAWILLLIGSLCPLFVVGKDGWIPAQVPILISFGVFLNTFLIYAIAVLVQYGWRNKDNE